MTKKWMLTSLSVLALATLAACSNNQSDQATSSSSSSSSMVASSSSATSSSSSSSEAASSSQMTSSKLDGTYTAKHEGDDLTLTIKGDSGQLTKLEVDGEQEIENVQVDETNMTLTIGDDVKNYEVKGNQLIVNDFDRELDDQVTFTKK